MRDLAVEKELIFVDGISKNYGERTVLNNISFKLNKGEIVGLLGKNGAGKTTILKIILGVLSSDRGHVYYQGNDLYHHPDLLNDIGALIDSSFLDYISAYENIKILMLASDKFQRNEIDGIIDYAFKLVALEKDKNLKINQYSFGMKQRLGLIQAILFSEDFMMLDEPFVGLDPIGKDIIKREITKKVREDNGCVLYSSHDLEDIRAMCDRVIMIDDGKIIYDGPIKQGKTYEVELLNQNEQIFTQLEKKFKGQIEIDVKQNIIIDEESINPLLKWIYDNDMGIQSISKVEFSLIELFKGGEYTDE